jgi:hypothetical protein
MFGICTDNLNTKSQDENSYGFAWSEYNSSYVAPFGYKSIYEAFQFKSASTLQGSPYQGKFNIYDGGGYLYEMRGQLEYLKGNLTLLREMNWIDRQTRAVFAEFSVYNPNINLVMVSTILVEFLSSGTILASAKFDTLNLFGFISLGSYSMLIECFIVAVFMLFIMYFLGVEVKSCLKRGPREYFADFWSFIELSIITTAWTSFSMFLVRLNSATQVLSFFEKTAGYGYIKLQAANDCNQMLTFSLGLCSTLGSIKFLKMFRFNRSISHLGQTLKICFGELVSFSFIFFIIWIAFVQLMFIIYNSTVEGYASISGSMATAFQVMLGKFDINAVLLAQPDLAPVILAAYNMAIVFFSLNIFISIITEAFDKVRMNAKKNPNEFDFYTFLMSKLRKIIDKKSLEESFTSYENYKDHLNILPSRLNRFINIILRVRNIYFKALKEDPVFKIRG